MDNRANILDQALQLFASRGYDAVGVQEICESAGITKPTLYHYFGSKVGLLKTLLDDCQGEFNQKVQAACHYTGWLPATLETLAKTFFQFAQEHPTYYRLALALYFAPTHSEAYRLINAYNEQQYAMVAEMFVAATKDNGNMRGRQQLLASTFIGMMNTCIGLWLNGYTELDNDLLQRVVKQFQHGIYS